MRNISDLFLRELKKENTLYCPFCGEHTFVFKKETGRFECSSCHTELTAMDLDELWRDSWSDYHEFGERRMRIYGIPMHGEVEFKYIVLNYGQHNLWDHSNTTTRFKITNDGKVFIEHFAAKGKEKWDESTETKRIKNMKQFYEWLDEIKHIIMTADRATIEPCDAGGVIETLAYTNFTIKNASMWLANDDKCLFGLPMPDMID